MRLLRSIGIKLRRFLLGRITNFGMPVWYWKRSSRQNLGDVCGFLLAERLSARPCYYEPLKTGRPTFVLIGSVLSPKLHKNCTIWGAGFIGPDESIPSGLRVVATRGPLSLQRLRQLGYTDSIAIGDPALLIPLIFPNVQLTAEYDVGIIPHYVDKTSFAERFNGRSSTRQESHMVIEIETDNLGKFIESLLRCRFIVSSSLHGVIIAHAFGIPAVWVRFSDEVVGGSFKFHDYFLSVGIQVYDGVDLTNGQITLPSLMNLRDIHQDQMNIRKFDPVPLIKACPFISEKVMSLLLRKKNLSHFFRSRENFY